ncbi:hypothetical protein [Thalassospira mesophila]|uniref:Uncharacterized protein n=1 Tax=Thalassospira mesophila TaxID=1293891 RepID=A0A1Y2KW49_9PROT|nr:hypothetical protein [Thalassospira mesophila]OSQ35999.1 hypothetical protein TMES_19435 [Thalassospira mesophila]
MYDKLITVMQGDALGVQAYEECARIAEKAIRDQPEAAAPFLLLGMIASRFIDAYRDQPLSRKIAEDQAKSYIALCTAFREAFEGGSDADRIKVLNDTAYAINTENL